MNTNRMRIASVFVAFLIRLGQALADCPNCTDGLVGHGPVKWVCPICDGVPLVGFQDPVPSKAGALDHRLSVVRIVSRHGDGASGGSGVVIDHAGGPAILTAHHVVFEDGKPGKVEVVFRDETRSPAKIVKFDDPYDLALLECEKYGAVAVPLAASPKLGESLTVAGFGSHPHTFREATGRVIGRGKPVGRYAADFIDVSAGARQGDSGGPIFNEAGEVAGILWGSDGRTTVGSHSDRLRAFLAGEANSPKELDRSASCPNGRCPKR